MPRKDPEARRQYNREYQHAWYLRNKQLQISRVRVSRVKRRERLAQWINQFKRRPCSDCGGEYPPYLMDFDHVTGDKLDDICGMRMRTVERETILAEIAKCEVVCANCHRARTPMRRLGVKVPPSNVMESLGPSYVSLLVHTR